jgi:general nucleoside transport system permease protein
MMLRTVGDSESAALALGFPVLRVRIIATALGGFLAGVGGSYLSLVYPGSWNEALSSGQGIMAVALVIFARWSPVRCVIAAMIFGGAGALGPALQSVGISGGYYLINAAPYVLTLALMIAANSSRQKLAGAPGELSLTR